MAKPRPKPKHKILIGVTASIAAYHSLDIVKELVRSGHDVDVVLTRDAEHFVTPLSLEALLGKKIYRDMFGDRHRDNPCCHIGLAEEAESVCIVPATADIIAKMACGIADNLLLAVLLSTKAPIVVAPAMNDQMYHHPATQQNIAILKKRGVCFVGPIVGHLACQKTDIGHIAESSTIIQQIEQTLK